MRNEENGERLAVERIMLNVARQDYPAGALYVLATPIGNAGDMTFRALYALSLMDAVACEDTRTTGTLLSQYGISRELIAVHQHNERHAAEALLARLLQGERIALVTDAGTPAISDPGAYLVQAVLSAGLRVVPVPGACAAIAALSASGFPADHFYFAGFLPARTMARESLLESLKSIPATLVMYEAPHRIGETLVSLLTVLGPDRRVVIAREITKLFEEVHSCRLSEAPHWLNADPNHARGELVLVVEGATGGETQDEAEARRILSILLEACPPSQAAVLTSRITGVRKKRLYEAAMQMKAE
ncbi:MAG: 16S rRNA (cytidine(1402)-2'-O)-methyltransferase [Burkholderiaceae bacterium]|jgi:16S rRNA (cytidine1402-2'-O)-methyltransferase|nr:16S rRNA (cytidine(1402)-2'-O)-methyltransferase [Burkholderiaceae bacterium]